MLNCINESFGFDFKIEKIEKIKGLPVYLKAGRTFYVLSDDINRFLLVKVKNNEKYGVVALGNQKKLYEEKSELFVAFWFDGLTRYQRDSLIKHSIPFIADGTQLYLPFLGVLIQNSFKQKVEVKTDKMMPITQSLFLYLLYKCNGKKVIKKEAAEYLSVTKTSITRASEQLEKMGLIRQEMSGKEYFMWTEILGLELFLKAKEYLINPIQTIFVTKREAVADSMPLSGETALAKYSMINPSIINVVAIDKTVGKNYGFEQIDERWEEDKQLIRVELWKYNPELFAKDGVVDPVSLYMSMKDIADERIEAALAEMLEEYLW